MCPGLDSSPYTLHANPGCDTTFSWAYFNSHLLALPIPCTFLPPTCPPNALSPCLVHTYISYSPEAEGHFQPYSQPHVLSQPFSLSLRVIFLMLSHFIFVCQPNSILSKVRHKKINEEEGRLTWL